MAFHAFAKAAACRAFTTRFFKYKLKRAQTYSSITNAIKHNNRNRKSKIVLLLLHNLWKLQKKIYEH